MEPGILVQSLEGGSYAQIACCNYFARFICSVAIAGPKEEALQVLERWTKAFSESDVDTIVKLYAPDTTFLGAGSKTVVVKSEEIRKYFEQALLTNRPRAQNSTTIPPSV